MKRSSTSHTSVQLVHQSPISTSTLPLFCSLLFSKKYVNPRRQDQQNGYQKNCVDYYTSRLRFNLKNTFCHIFIDL